ncbi:MAG: hypothetical protein GYB36_08070 [Alphaproteobacteria bacterium]|nr:hypothetical protein [Alphaproteobacteria bacterium]
MFKRKARMRLAAVLIAISALSGTSAQAMQSVSRDGAPLRAGQDCALQYIDRSLAGALYIKAGAGQSGSYRLTINRYNDANDVLISMSGSFTGSATDDTLIARAYLTSRNLMDARRDALVVQGRDVYLINGSLEIFDARGRLTCHTPQVDVIRGNWPASIAPAPPPSARPAPRPRGFGPRF